MSIEQITVRVAGQDETYPRNRVKKIILVERETIPSPADAQADKKP